MKTVTEIIYVLKVRHSLPYSSDTVNILQCL